MTSSWNLSLIHIFGAYLLVDEAHGAHFPFVNIPSAAAQGADLAVVSTHKTWPALGSSSILYRNQTFPLSKQQLKAMSSVFATTSPSYPILASIDYAREQLEGALGEAYRRTARYTSYLREAVNEKTPFHALCDACLLYTSLPSRGPFHLSLTVLLLYRSSGSI